jgi:hypothetical protein
MFDMHHPPLRGTTQLVSVPTWKRARGVTLAPSSSDAAIKLA